MRIFIFLCSFIICGLMLILLQVIVVCSGRCWLQLWMLVWICLVSLWVGIRISVCIEFVVICGFFRVSCCSNGRVKLVVLLVLVCVVVSRLWFLSVGGMVWVWIGVGVLWLSFLRVLSRGVSRLREVNVMSDLEKRKWMVFQWICCFLLFFGVWLVSF